MDLSRLSADLDRDEGLRLKPYVDSVGKITIGRGRNLTDRGISVVEAEFLFQHDLIGAITDARRFPWFDTLHPVRQAVVVNMLFNLGASRFRPFVKLIAALDRGDYDQAAAEMLDSKWAADVGTRAHRLAREMRTGSP